MNDNNDFSCDEQLLAEQVTTEPSIQRRPEQQLPSTSSGKKKCRGNRKEQYARRRLRKRDLKEAITVSRVGIITETQLTMMNTEMTDEPSNSMIAPTEEMTQV